MHTLHYYQKIPAAPMWMCRIIYKVTFCLLGWSPDRGSAQHMREREQRKSPALVATGRLVNASRMLLLVDTAVFKDALVLIAHCTCCRHAGHSRVEYIQKHYLFLHAWKRGEAIRFTKRITLYSRQWSSWQLGRPAHCNCCVVQTSSMLPYTRLCMRCLRSWQSFTLLHSFSSVCCGGAYFGESSMLWHYAGSHELHVIIQPQC